MAKQTDEIEDTDDVVDEKPDTSIRGALTAAMEEHKEDEGQDGVRQSKISGDEDNTRRTRKGKSDTDSDVDVSADDKDTDKTKKFKQKETEDTEGEVPTEKSTQELKLKAPPGWTKEGKTHWDALPPDVQKSVIKREDEVSNGIKQYADKAKAYDEYEQVIAPYRQQIQSFGVSPVQTIDRLFKWMNALSHPDQNYKLNSFKELANAFNFNIAQLTPVQRNAEDSQNTEVNPQQQPDNNPPAWAQTMYGEVNSLKQNLADSRQQAATQVINNWAKDKPHFEKVRTSMFNLIQTGEVPLKDGNLDLDGAYAKACRLNDEVSAQIQQEAAEKAETEAKAKAAKDAKDKADRLLKAKRAGVGLKPVAPSLTASGMKPNSKPNGSGNKSISVRDSLAQTFQQLREGD